MNRSVACSGFVWKLSAIDIFNIIRDCSFLPLICLRGTGSECINLQLGTSGGSSSGSPGINRNKCLSLKGVLVCGRVGQCRVEAEAGWVRKSRAGWSSVAVQPGSVR